MVGLRPGWVGLRAGWLGLRTGWMARKGGWTDGRRENLPILQDFVPYRGRCPKRLQPWAPRLKGPRRVLVDPL